MNKPINLRFIPKWLSGAIDHYGADVKEFESIVSRHDVGLYRLANNLLESSFRALRIVDFTFPDSDLHGSFSADDSLFALYGPNSEDKKVAEYVLSHFVILPDKYDGILLVEKDAGEQKQLIPELLQALALYRGAEQAYGSTTFKRYLSLVNSDRSVSKSHAVHLEKDLESNPDQP